MNQILIKFIHMLKIHTKYQFLTKKRESTGSKHLHDSKAFIEFFNNMDNTYKNLEKCNLNRKLKILVIFDDMVSDMFSNKKLNSIANQLFLLFL